ncbi:PstS family phosphate ABC transporter substrate-binding protein [Streptomyces sp. NBC_01423]|uniref:PstS family phosphate ABC transporter substrate-binding protein n=1 Tax=Streptomyces sp. NBC_01423 TaxID=2903860 RepID=UPI002E281E59|nr:substrate-binding domain-containing protein [Streptomyces sp. NBC_01423]
MRRAPRAAAALALTTTLVVAGTLTSEAQTDNDAEDFSTWAVAPQKPVTPQTDDQDEYNKAHGRPLPDRELLQPSLDSGLTSYKAKPKNSLHGDYQCAASDVLAALSKTWIKEFEKRYPRVHISVKPPYAGSLGALELVKGNLDCVFVSRELKPTDIDGFHDAFGYDPLSVPISGGSYRHFGFLDSIGIVVNKDNPIDKLSFDQLDAAFSTTRNRGGSPAVTWGDLGATGKWADKPVHIVGLQPWNGFEEFVRQRVLNANGKRGEWRPGATDGSAPADPNVHWEKTVFPIAKDVKDDPYAIGYTGMAYVDQGVKVIALSEHNGGTAYPPTYENVASAAYPLSRVTYFNVNKRPGKQLDPVMEELMRFILSKQGQNVVSGQQVFLPLRAQQAEASKKALRQAP